MLATLAAIHLVVLTQVAPPREVTPADAMPEEATPEEGIRPPVEVTAPPALPARERAAPPAAPPASGIWATPPAAPAAQDSGVAPPATAYSGTAPPATAPPQSAPPAYPAPSYPAPSYPAPSYPAPSYPAPTVGPENPPLPSKPGYPAPSRTAPSAPAQTEPYPRPPGSAEPVPLPKPPDAAPALPPPRTEPARAQRDAFPPSPGAPPPAAQPPAGARRLSLLSGEPLRGGSTALAWAGWSALGLAYGQGITAKDDLGGFADYDWATSELVVGLAYRRHVGKAGGWDMASRLSAGWFSNFGSTLVDDDNRSDRGLEVSPGLSVSRSGEAGVFSAIVEGPITVTWKYGAGLLFAPRLTLAFEAPVYPEVTVGFRAGAAYRAGAGEAPLKVGAPEFVFLVLAGYHLL